MLTRLILNCIDGYQKYWSPRKGFACAYRVAYGGCGCSGVGKRLIRRYGAFSGCLLLRKRLAHCRFAAKELREIKNQSVGYAKYQRGDCIPCDVPCDGNCTAPSSWDLPFELGEKCEILLDTVCSCGDCSGCGGSGEEAKPKKKRLEMPNLRGSDD